MRTEAQKPTGRRFARQARPTRLDKAAETFAPVLHEGVERGVAAVAASVTVALIVGVLVGAILAAIILGGAR